jgi:hypothetical protein
MRDGKLYLCAAFFLLLTALRFFLPDWTGQAQNWVRRSVDPAGECRGFVQALGQQLDGTGLRDGLVAVFRFGEEALS